jgi:hypothetical protein
VSAAALHLAVSWTARLSAVSFALSLLVPALSPKRAGHSGRLQLAFIVAHTLHFAFVAWLAGVTGGAGMFPGGRSVAEVGGWPVVLAIVALFYAVAFTAFTARRAGASRARLRTAGKLANAFIGFMFVATYVPLVARSGWYALPALLVMAAVAADLRPGARGTRVPRRSASPAPGNASTRRCWT